MTDLCHFVLEIHIVIKRLQVIHVAACNLLLSVVIVQSGLPGEDDLISWRQLLVSYNRPITWSGLLFFWIVHILDKRE